MSYRGQNNQYDDDDDDDTANNQQGYNQQGYDQDDDDQDDDGQQGVVYDQTQSDDDQAEQEAGEEAVDPSIRVQPVRTQSDPLPSQEAARDKADQDYHPEIVMIPDEDEEQDEENDAEIKFTATLDSGCDDNWISWTKMQEKDIGTDKVTALADTPGNTSSAFTDFSGGDVEPAGQVQLRWRASGSGKSDDSVFYVLDNENAPFDVLFGRTWMDQHDGGPNFFKKPVLINAGKPFSAAEKERKAAGVRGTSTFAAPEADDESAPAPAPVQSVASAPAATPAAAEGGGMGKWGKKLAGGFSKLSHH